MTKTIGCLLSLLFASVQVHAADAFDKIQCGPDVAKALSGQRMSDEPVAAIEGRYAELGLKDLGGSEVSDHLFSGSWRICGSEFVLLMDDHSVIRDVLPFPPHSKTAPGFSGSCEASGKKVEGTLVAVLNDEPGAKTLAAQSAWKIDEKAAKFVKLPTDGLRCPRDGIFTVDGGR